MFEPSILNVTSQESIQCRCYQLSSAIIETDDSESSANNSSSQSSSSVALPSKTYLDLILDGAAESQLPDDYLSKLKSVKHNGETAEMSSDRKVYL